MEQLTQHDPRRIGPFEVLGRLGAGGMGLVYLARSASGRRVAIKTVRTELAEDQLFRVRFTREVEAARAVSGFYTAAVVDADPRAAVPWLATAYVPAPSLEEIVNECGPLPAQAVRWLAAGIAEALQSIHGAGLVHRDLKPSNVLVVEDGPRVIDFGIASGVSNTRLTMTNVAVGTPAYMSPEQAKDSRSVTGAQRRLLARLDARLRGHRTRALPRRQPRRDRVHAAARGPGHQRACPTSCARSSSPACRWSTRTGPPPRTSRPSSRPTSSRSGSDDSGTASAWLPPALGRDDRAAQGRRPHAGRRPARRPRAELVPAVQQARGGPAAPPRPADPPYAARHGAAPVTHPPRHADEPVRLPGAKVPIGPGPRVADAARVSVDAGPTTGWVPQARRAPASPTARWPPPYRRPRTRRRRPGRWRPWRFRMSNDVWGTPAVAGDLLYVTSFEVHALDVASGRRQFKTRDVAWAMAVEAGRIHASDGPTLYALDAADGGELWRLPTDAWVYSLKADRGTVVTGTRGGGVQAWEAANGEKLWELSGAQSDFETPEAGPSIHDGTVYVWQDARLRALDARTRRRALVLPGRRRGLLRRRPGAGRARAGRLRLRLGGHPRPGHRHRLRPRPLALRGARRLPVPADVRAGPGGGRRRRVPRRLPRHRVRPGRRRPARTAGASPPSPASPSSRSWSPTATSTWAAATRSTPWTRSPRPPSGASRRAARWWAPRSSPTAASTSARPTTASTPWTRRAASSAGSSPPAARSPARRWSADGVVYACSKDRCVYALDAVKGTATSGSR